mgnify:CR=1 FL=1
MSTGFIATAPTAPDEGEITNSPFWPAISLPDLRETVRLDGTVTTARLKHAVIDAITSVNRDLADWRRAVVRLCEPAEFRLHSTLSSWWQV